MIEEQAEQDFSSTYSVYQPLDDGASWADRNLTRIEDLMQQAEKVSPVKLPDSDDIPF